jgi:hypothetical protein
MQLKVQVTMRPLVVVGMIDGSYFQNRTSNISFKAEVQIHHTIFTHSRLSFGTLLFDGLESVLYCVEGVVSQIL